MVKALAGVLAIQVAQSLTLIVALEVFFAPSGWTPFGPKPSGLLNLLIALALIYVLLKIPFWIMSSMRVGGSSRSFVGSLLRVSWPTRRSDCSRAPAAHPRCGRCGADHRGAGAGRGHGRRVRADSR